MSRLPFPSAPGNMHSLWLSECELTTIPLDLLGGGAFEHVRELHLADNKDLSCLSGLAACVPLLEILDVYGCGLRRLPDDICTLQNLRILNASHNMLEALPSTLPHCTALVTLSLGHNRIMELPDNFGALRSLHNLRITHNRLQTLPREVASMPCLSDLRLNENELLLLPNFVNTINVVTGFLGNPFLGDTLLPVGLRFRQGRDLRDLYLSLQQFAEILRCCGLRGSEEHMLRRVLLGETSATASEFCRCTGLSFEIPFAPPPSRHPNLREIAHDFLYVGDTLEESYGGLLCPVSFRCLSLCQLSAHALLRQLVGCKRHRGAVAHRDVQNIAHSRKLRNRLPLEVCEWIGTVQMCHWCGTLFFPTPTPSSPLFSNLQSDSTASSESCPPTSTHSPAPASVVVEDTQRCLAGEAESSEHSTLFSPLSGPAVVLTLLSPNSFKMRHHAPAWTWACSPLCHLVRPPRGAE
eukprot:gnl/Spiro4/26989_TR13428_c0_g1_i1.p1 gnl/Spiro4/26989_TR13428_c0_g1~~gnl/Spiro4/26989_TR13428_c0_g1_i1.p1  ORF type:complete len:467 (-),score=20.19 gnl/Spiro4/26989_TR13428_c0_g1_i1:49-1449(-)